MTAAELIAELAKLPPDTPVVHLNSDWTYSTARLELRKMYRTVSGTYSRFRAEMHQHRNDTQVVVIS